MSEIEKTTPLVFLHAYPLDSRQWSRVAGRFTERRVLAPDLPGFGQSPLGGETLDGFADAVIEQMNSAGIDSAAIVGLSMGGYVAFRLYDRWPERVAGLVLADTRAGADGEDARERRTEQAERARREGVEWLPEVMIGVALGETTRREKPAVVERVRQIIEDADPEGVARALTAMRDRPDSSEMLSRIDVPVLVIVGEEDGVTPMSDARAMADAVPQGRLVEIPTAGHYTNLENEDAFVTAIQEFLGDRPEAR